MFNKFAVAALCTAMGLAAPHSAEAKEFKFNWKRSISSGVFDQETFFHWTERGADGICRNDTTLSVKVKKRPKKGTFQWLWVSKVLPSGECAGVLVSGYQFVYAPKRKPKKDRVVVEISGLDRFSEGLADRDKARVEIQIRKR